MQRRGVLFESLAGDSRFWLTDSREVIIGRRPPSEPQHVRVASVRVAREHARLVASPEGLLVEDAGSSGGLYLDDELVRGRVAIRPGMRLQLNAKLVYGLRELSGESLWDLLRSRPLPLATALRLASDVLRALTRLHALDRAHGGLSPHEILAANDGSFTLLVQGWTVITDGVLNCNPAYAAPESFCEGRLEPATDIYALALIVFEALAGRRPYTIESPQLNMMAKLHGPEPLPEPDWPEALRTWLARMMQVDPHLRPSAAEALADISSWGLKGP